MQFAYKPSPELSLVLKAATIGCKTYQASNGNIKWQDINWKKTLKLAKFHGLSCWLAEYLTLVDQVPLEVTQTLANQRKQQLLFLTYSEQQICELVSQLQGAGIRFALLKGTAIARPLYGKRWYYRPRGDVDILIDPQQLELAFEKLKMLGYLDVDKKPLNKAAFRKIAFDSQRLSVIEHSLLHPNGHLPLDIHWRLRCSRLFPISDSALFADVTVDQAGWPHLAGPMEFIHLCVHGLGDGWKGLKSLVDILYFAEKTTDWSQINRCAERLGLLHVVNASLAICDFFFQTNYAPARLTDKERTLLVFCLNNFTKNSEFPSVHSYLDNRNIFRFVQSSLVWWSATSSELSSTTMVLKSIAMPNKADLQGDIAVNRLRLCGYFFKRMIRLLRVYYWQR